MSTGSIASQNRLGAVVIGRNEGERLRRCLGSLIREVDCCVYVDSGSTDGSVALAQSLGVRVVHLDMNRPFTAARARNEGFASLRSQAPELDCVQFVDGDCELAAGWLMTASAFLAEHPDSAVVCGRRRERFPERSIFNQQCDTEWNTPVGEAHAFGGDALVRCRALEQVGGYRDDLIAGEEPELAIRLRRAGWRIHRVAADMTWHDAAIVRWSQWWRRSQRGGHAYAEGAFLHGRSPERHFVAQTRRALAWGLGGPLCLVLATVISPWGALLALAYPLQVLRIALRARRAGTPSPWWLGVLLVAGKFPEAQGVLTFHWRRWSRSGGRLIEYK